MNFFTKNADDAKAALMAASIFSPNKPLAGI
jgi:hypothetical protein